MRTFGFVLVVVALLACGGSEPTPPVPPSPTIKSLTITPVSASVGEEDTVRLTATAKDAAGAVMVATVTWTTLSASVTVDPSGLVRGVTRGGPFTVQASAGGLTATASITVIPAAVAVQIAPSSASIAELDSIKLTATATGKNGQPIAATFVWTALGPGVTVNQNGWVRGVSPGGPVSVQANAAGFLAPSSAKAEITVTLAPLAPGLVYFGAPRSAFAGGPFSREINRVNPITLEEKNLTADPADDDYPVVSPDGQYLWFYTYRFVQRGEYVIMKKDGTSVRRLFTGCQWNDGGALFGYCVHPTAWLPDSRLVYTISDKSLPSLTTILITSVLTPSTGAVQAFTGAGSSAFSTFSPSGTLGFRLAGGFLEFVRMSDGVTTTLAPSCTFTTACTLAAWAADEKSIYAFREGSLYEFPIDGSAGKKLYTATGTVSEMVVSPNGAQIAFVEGESLRLFTVGGSAAPRTVSPTTGQVAWSPDSKSLAFTISEFNNGVPGQIWGINANGTGKKMLSASGVVRGISWGK